jgi:PAS domain S-box-containing protein
MTSRPGVAGTSDNSPARSRSRGEAPVDRKRYSAAMVGLGECLEDTLTQASDGAVVVNRSRQIVLWNPAAEQIIGYSAREVVGGACCLPFIGHDDDSNCCPLCSVTALSKVVDPERTVDLRTRTKAGSRIWLNVTTIAAKGRDGEWLTVHIFRDVTSTKELLAQIRQRWSTTESRTVEGASGCRMLTRRELELLRLLGVGLNTADAAERLHVSRTTVRNHVQHIFKKLGVHSRLQAVAYATRFHLV